MLNMEKLKYHVNYEKINKVKYPDTTLCSAFYGCPQSAMTIPKSLDCNFCIGSKILKQELIDISQEPITSDNFVETITIALTYN